MWHVFRSISVCAAVLLAGAALAADPDVPADVEPLDLGTTETTRVRLLLFDVVVVDGKGRTVPDLTRDDFEVVSRGTASPIDSLDVNCPIGATDDARVARRPGGRDAIPLPDQGRRTVLLFDYLHLQGLQRESVFEQAMAMARSEMLGGDEVMVAALTGGLRIEQKFTSDPDELFESLRRMRHDITLWNGNFSHLSENGFVNGLVSLMDVLGMVPGRKSIVLFSMMRDVPLDLQFREIAAAAAVNRCSFYPVDAVGLIPGVIPSNEPRPG